MKKIKFGKSTIYEDGPVYFIAEIGHNHQGKLETALEMIEVAARNGADAVKLQKRDNKVLFTKEQYNKPYDNENSYGATYGEHREYLEFGKDEYLKLKKHAEKHNVEFFATPFDEPSVDFLEDIGVNIYKVSSGDLTSVPLLKYIAKKGKPMIVSTGACNLDEIKIAYDEILKINNQLILLHCSAGYPTDYPDLNLRGIETLVKEFPKAIIGYSGHDNGILAPVIAHMLGAQVVEKHFTLNRSWKGTDHKFSLEPEGLRKTVRDLRRVKEALGDSKKIIRDFEASAREKMGKSIFTAHPLKKGSVISEKDLVFKSPGGKGLPPYELDKVLGKKLKDDLDKESPVLLDNLT